MTSTSNDDLILPKILNNSIEQSKDTHLESNYNNEKDSQELIDLKQININDKNYLNRNINITNSTILDKISSIVKKDSKTSLNIKTNTNNQPQKIIEKYEKRINDLETKLSQIDSFHMKEISKLNEEINIKDKNLKLLSKVNKNLRNSLNNLTHKLDELLYKFTKDQKKLNLKNNNGNNKEKNFEEQLLLKEKELKNQQNMINILSKDNKKLRHSLEIQNNFELNRSLSDKLLIKEKEIINLNKIIKDYEHKYKKHNECQKEIDSLKEKLINNQKELSEKKKEIFISHKNITELHSKIINSENAINIINKNIKERKRKEKLKLNLNGLNNSPDGKIGTTINNKKIYSPIFMHRELSENNRINKNIDISNNHKNNIIYNIFTKEEIDIIKKLYENNTEKFIEFQKKVEILEKYRNSKDKAYIVAIKKLKLKIDDYIEQNNLAENTVKDKESKIFFLTRQLKDIIKKKKDLYENNKKLILLLNKETKKYEEEKKAKKDLAILLLKYQTEANKLIEINPNESHIIKETNSNFNLNLNLNENNNDIINNKNEIGKENDKNIIVLKDILKPNPISKNIISNKKINMDDSYNNISINKEIKNGEKDMELESILSKNMIDTPKKKKFEEYQINSNISHVEIKGIKRKKNKEVLFETQPKENGRKKYNIALNLNNNTSSNGNNNKIIINRRGSLLPYKKSESVDKANKNIKEILKRDELNNKFRRKSLLIRDKSESAIVTLLNSDKNLKINKNDNNNNNENNISNNNSKIHVLFEN